MDSITTKKALTYSTTMVLGAATGLGALALALPLIRKIGLNAHSWPTRLTFAASGGLIGAVIPKLYEIATRRFSGTGSSVVTPKAADLSEKDRQGALIDACWHGDVDGARRLITDSASVWFANSDGNYPLHRLVSNKFGTVEMVHLLLDSGAKVNGRGSHDETPLHKAVLFGAPIEVVQVLLDRGASLTLTNAWANDALAVARWNCPDSDVCRLIEEATRNA